MAAEANWNRKVDIVKLMALIEGEQASMNKKLDGIRFHVEQEMSAIKWELHEEIIKIRNMVTTQAATLHDASTVFVAERASYTLGEVHKGLGDMADNIVARVKEALKNTVVNEIRRIYFSAEVHKNVRALELVHIVGPKAAQELLESVSVEEIFRESDMCLKKIEETLLKADNSLDRLAMRTDTAAKKLAKLLEEAEAKISQLGKKMAGE